MNRILNQKHQKETFYYSLSRLLERLSYFGLRYLIVLYMIGESLNMLKVEAYSIYAWFLASLVFSQVLGAILGDLLIGNKKAIISGGIIQSLGAFSLCIPSSTGLYLGLSLVVLGGGLYTPNIISNFGKLYLNKSKLLDAGFTIFYMAVNIGAFLGAVLIGYINYEYGWNWSFIVIGILMLLSILPILFSKENKTEKSTIIIPTINQRIIKIAIAFVGVGLFWAIYDLGNIRIMDLQLKLSEISTLNISESMLESLNPIFVLLTSIVMMFVWTFYYNSQWFKLFLGFAFGVISFGVLLLIPEIPSDQHTIIYLISIFFLSISEIHIAPIIHSVLAKYSNPKYLAIIVSLAFIPSRIFSLIFIFFSFYEKPILGLKIAVITMAVIGIMIFFYVRWDKKSSLQ